MSGPDPKKLDPLIIALGGIGRTPGISKQQLVDAVTLVINGKITQSWEQSKGMTREKTELIQAKRALSELSFNGEETVDNSIQEAVQDIIMKLSVYKRLKAEEEARQKAEEEAREKAEEARKAAEEEARQAAQDAQGGGDDDDDALGGGDGALPNPTDNDDAEEEYNDYSSSN